MGLSPLFDFFGVAALVLLSGCHIFFLLQNVTLDLATATFVITATILNLIGLFVAVAYQRTVFTITFFFTLFFFSLAPMQQLIYHFDPVMADQAILQRAFGFCLIFSVICLVALLVMGVTSVQTEIKPRLPEESFSASGCALLFACLCASIFVGLLAFGHGLATDRTTYSDLLASEASQPVALLYVGTLRPFVIYGSVIGLWLAWTHRQVGWCAAFAATLIGGFILANPLIAARFEVATVICAIIFYFTGRRRCRYLVAALLLGVTVAPVFNLFRYGDTSFEYGTINSFLATMDYDAFSLLCHTIWHVDYHGLDYGKNILSSVLFFIPRSVWPDKSEVTPYYMMDSLATFRGLWNYNLSEPLIAEGYFAFGIIGLILISLVYVWFAWLLEIKAGDNRLNTLYLFCCAAPPLLFILLRGSLIVGMSVVVGNLFAIMLAMHIVTLRFASIPKARLHLPRLGVKRRSSRFSTSN